MSNCRVEVVESQALVQVLAGEPVQVLGRASALASALGPELALELVLPPSQLRRLAVFSPWPECLRVGPHLRLDAPRHAEQEAPPFWTASLCPPRSHVPITLMLLMPQATASKQRH